MEYLRWSWSPWYAHSHIDGDDGDDALLVGWHEAGFRFEARAWELDRAGCAGSPGNLLAVMARKSGVDAAALADADSLAPAVDQFLFEVRNAGKIPMPPKVARRFRVLKRRLGCTLRQRLSAPGEHGQRFPQWFHWQAEIAVLDRQYPPPRLPREIRDLMQARALRSIAGRTVSAEQDVSERLRISAALDAWPPV